MGSGIFFPIAAIPFSLLIIFLYFIKGHVESKETKIFQVLIITNLFGLIIELLCTFASLIYHTYPLLSELVYKSYLLYLILWISTFAYYMFSVVRNEMEIKKKRYIVFVIYYIIMAIILLFLPINIIISDSFSVRYTTGASVNFTYIISAVAITVIVLLLIFNFKKIKNKKIIPVFVFLLIGGIAICIQAALPQLLLMTYVETLICVIMYFTIENPDLKVLAQVTIARDHAQKANRAKTDFLSSMSHEIRTPLNAIVGLSEDISTYKHLVPDAVIEDTDDIRNASQTLLEIVGNILDLNKIEAEKMEIVETAYDLRKEVENLCRVTSTRIGDKNIKFSLSIAEDLPYELIGDKVHIKQIINNVLSNAIKYTEFGEIHLNVKCVNNLNKGESNLMITCQDTGRGIKAELVNKLFNKFERLDIEKNTTAEGTGLGLAITKSLVEMMGGKINVQSQFGQGSIFIINIPQKISKVVKPQTEKELVNTGKQIFFKSYEPKMDNVGIQYEVTQENNLEKFSNKKILIVDDNNLNIKVASKALIDLKFEIDECYDGIQCLEKIAAGNKYDLILMDIMMPNMSGEEAMVKLREIPNFNTPVIALTADAITGAKEKYLSEGFVDYIAKPFSRIQIKEKLDIIFDKPNQNH